MAEIEGVFMRLVSIIIPIFNTEISLLKKCISSLLNQDYSNIEILLINDGSKQELSTEYDKIATEDSRIKIFHKANGGVSSARNLGLKNATGEYIAFVDGDDWVKKSFISTLVSSIDENNCDLAITGVNYVFPNKDFDVANDDEKIEILDKAELFYRLFYSDNVGGYLCNKLFKRELITRTLNETIHFCEDFEFVADYCQNVLRAAYIPTKLYNYLQRVNDVHTIPKYTSRAFSLIDAREKITEIYRKQSPKNAVAMETTVLKAALKLRARYKINKIDNKNEFEIIKNTIKKYLKKCLFSKKVSFSEKINITLTYIFPKTLIRLKLLLKKGS